MFTACWLSLRNDGNLVVHSGGWTSTCMVCMHVCDKKSGMQLFFPARSSEVKVSNFKQPLLGSVKDTEVFEVVQKIEQS